jgi:anti-anti-sigma factor
MAELTVIEHSDTLTHVALDGRLDAAGVGRVELRFTSHVAARRKPTIVDVSSVEFIASLGIGMLISTARTLAAHGVTIVLLSPQREVAKMLRASSIDTIIPFADSRDEALGLLGFPA